MTFLDSQVLFSWIFAPGGRLNHEALQTKILNISIHHGRKLLGEYFKTYFDWKIIIQLPVYAMYVCYVCILYILCIVCMVCMVCMYAMYVFYVCMLCMYSTYAFRIFVCKASWLSRPPGAKIHEKQHLRIQGGHFLKSA